MSSVYAEFHNIAIPRTFFIEVDMLSNNDNEMHFNCSYCGNTFNRKCACAVHELYCDKNPNRKTRRNDSRLEHTCVYCGRVKYTTASAHTSHEKHCSCNPNRIERRPRRHWSKEEREQISIRMKAAIRDGRAHGWANVRQNIGGMSYPEIWFSNMLNTNGFADFEYNKPFYKYKLDFAWTAKRLCIEIDGSQHYLIPERKISDEQKDALLHKNGWKVLRLKWGYICKNPSKTIEMVKMFLDGVGDITIPLYKTIAEQIQERHAKCIADGVLKDKGGRYNRLLLSDADINNRMDAILKSGVDLTKLGWVSKVSEQTGLTRRVIYKTVESCEELKKLVYRRTPCGEGTRAVHNPIYENGHISETEYERRLKIILDTGVDFQSVGWRKYLIEHTGFSRDIITTTLNHYSPRYDNRKCSKSISKE